jgi:two-component system response regulator YesN
MKFADYFIAVFALSEKNRENCKDLKYDMKVLNFGLSNIIGELCDGIIHDYFVSTYCGFSIVLAVDGVKKESSIITYIFKDIKKFIKESLNINIIIGVSENYHGLSGIRDAYQQAHEQVSKQKYCAYSDAETIEQGDTNEMFMEKKKILIKSIYACDSDCAHKVIDWIFNMESMTGIPVKQIKVMNALLLNGLVSLVNDIDCNTIKAIGTSRSIYNKFSELRNLEYCKQFLIDIIDELITSLTDRKLMIKNECKKSIFDYVDQNYNKDIKLYSIAEKFNIDLKDLSRMFIEDMGKSFSKYMVELKVSKAKHLLCNTQMKVYEIGKFIGYSDIKYFSKIFKELEGVTPMEYKKQMKNLKII